MSLSGSQITGLGAGGAIHAYAGFVAKIETDSRLWSDATVNTSVWYAQNQTPTTWDSNATFWDLDGNVYRTVFDVNDTTYSDATVSAAIYYPIGPGIGWDGGTLYWDLNGNTHTAEWV